MKEYVREANTMYYTIAIAYSTKKKKETSLLDLTAGVGMTATDHFAFYREGQMADSAQVLCSGATEACIGLQMMLFVKIITLL